jgi:agmatine deiminase
MHGKYTTKNMCRITHVSYLWSQNITEKFKLIKVLLFMKRFYSVLAVLLFFFCSTSFAQWMPDSKPDYRKLRYLSEEEMLIPVRTNINFTETPPPPGNVRLVAEYEPMQAVLIRYPFGIPYTLIRALASDIQLITLVASNNEANIVLSLYQNNNVNTANCSFLVAPTNSYWTRDYGPWFIFDGNNQPGIVDFPYNRPRPNDNNVPPRVAEHLNINLYGMNLMHTGGNMMSDGFKIGASTDLVYEDNTQLSASQVAQKMDDYLGIERYDVTIDPLADYIKHIDCWGKYLAPDKILLGQVLPSDPRYNDFEAVANYFATTPSAYGYPYKVYRVYTPGGNPSTPYTNSLILNNKVFVPTTGSQHDNAAIAVYQQAMPGYEIIPIQHSSGNTRWQNTDALHCRTHEVADLGMLFVNHMPLYGLQSWQDSIQLTAAIIPYSGQALIDDSLRIFYSINGQDYNSVSLSNSNETAYSGYIKNYTGNDTIRYFIAAADASGRSIRHPYMGALDPHMFVLGDQMLTDITIAPDTVYFVDNYFGSFVIKNQTANEVLIDEIMPIDEDYFVMLPSLPEFPFVLAQGDSLVVEVEIRPGVFALNPTLNYVIFEVGVETNLSNRAITLLVNDQLISQSPETALTNFSVRPNPFSESVVFTFTSLEKQDVELIIFDLQGRRLFSKVVASDRNMSNEIRWDANEQSGLSAKSGLYFYQLKTNNGLRTGKIIRY